MILESIYKKLEVLKNKKQKQKSNLTTFFFFLWVSIHQTISLRKYLSDITLFLLLDCPRRIDSCSMSDEVLSYMLEGHKPKVRYSTVLSCFERTPYHKSLARCDYHITYADTCTIFRGTNTNSR